MFRYIVNFISISFLFKLKCFYCLSDQSKLLEHLFLDYRKNTRPVLKWNETVVVYFDLTLVHVLDMEEKNQVLVTNCWLTMTWIDVNLKWKPLEHSGISSITVPDDRIWLPDIVLYNNADDFSNKFTSSQVILMSDGVVSWAPPVRLRSSCKLNIAFFPFDSQICSLKFGSWMHPSNQLDIRNSSNIVNLDLFTKNGEWSIKHTKIEKNQVKYPISTNYFSDVTIVLYFERLTSYYIIYIILPCIWLNFLNISNFCVPCDSGEKISLGITILLAYSVFMLLIAENIPVTSESVPIVGIYLTLSMIITTCSILLSIFILNLHNNSSNMIKLPKYVNKKILGKISCRIFLKDPCKFCENFFKKNSIIKGNQSLQIDKMRIRQSAAHASYSNANERNIDCDDKSLLKESILRKYSEKVTESEDIFAEWRLIAVIVDRIFLIVFALLTFIMIFILLIVTPLINRSTL